MAGVTGDFAVVKRQGLGRLEQRAIPLIDIGGMKHLKMHGADPTAGVTNLAGLIDGFFGMKILARLGFLLGGNLGMTTHTFFWAYMGI